MVIITMHLPEEQGGEARADNLGGSLSPTLLLYSPDKTPRIASPSSDAGARRWIAEQFSLRDHLDGFSITSVRTLGVNPGGISGGVRTMRGMQGMRGVRGASVEMETEKDLLLNRQSKKRNQNTRPEQ